MASLVKNKGKVGMPSFYSSTSTTIKSKAEGVKSKLPLFALLILAGVAIIFVLRNRSSGSSTQTGAALTVIPSGEADLSTIANITAGINALAGQVHTPSDIPSGGTSTPITTTPNPVNTPSGGTPTTGSGAYSGQIVTGGSIGGNPNITSLGAAQVEANRQGQIAAGAQVPGAAYPGAVEKTGYTGVSGTNIDSSGGVSYTIFQNGQQVATVIGNVNTDILALAKQYGIDANQLGTVK